jgi:RHS repeat-associated protein
MSKTVNGSTTNQVWNLSEGLPVIIQDGSTKEITGPGGLPIEQVAGDGTILYYLQDQLGSSRGLTDQSGSIVATYSYVAYGSVTASSGTESTPFQYAGQYTDSESGLQYLRARYYDPQTAQFLSVDPLVGLTQQPYGYAAENPMYWSDPSGLCVFGLPCPEILQKAGATLGSAAGWAGSALTAKQRSDPPAITAPGAVFTAEGVREIVRHLGQLDGGLDDPANQQMLARMDEILAGVREPCAEDANWYNHELYESSLYDQNPPGPGEDPDAY